MNLLFLLGLGIAAYLYAAPKSLQSNIVSIFMSSPAQLSGEAPMRALAAQFGFDEKSIYDGALTSPGPGQLIFSLGFIGVMPRLPAIGQTFVVNGVPVKITNISIAPARVPAP
jgi:hypothetical protein